jgi:hypothetical protein
MNDVLIPLTNAKLNSLSQSLLKPDEFLLFLGITLSMALQPLRGGIDAYWAVDNGTNGTNDTVYTPGNYGERFGMPKHRFKCIRKCMTMGTAIQTTLVPGVPAEPDKDPWGAIRPFIDAFNSCRSKCMTPGKVITVDEVMSMWFGLDGDNAVEGLPHVTKIQRKPRGIGAELKVAADGREYPKAFMAGWYAAGSPPNPNREIGSHIVLKVLLSHF